MVNVFGDGQVDRSDIDWAAASFRLFGDTLNPNVVSERLGLAASHSGVMGDPRDTGGKTPPVRWRTGTWILESRLPRSAKLDPHLRDVLDHLQGQASQIQDFVAVGYSADIFCGCSLEAPNEEITLEPDTLRRLGLLGVPLRLDIYCLGDPPAMSDDPQR